MLRKIIASVWIVLLVSSSLIIAQEKFNREEFFLSAEDYRLDSEMVYKSVIEEVYKGEIGGREVYITPGPVKGGTVIDILMGKEFEVPEGDSWVLFIDEMPPANWSHPAKIIFVDATKGDITKYDCGFPPRMLPEFEGITEGAKNEIKRVEGIEWWKEEVVKLFEEYPFKGESDNHKYHVLISGGINAGSNNSRYLNDLKFIYVTLNMYYSGNSDDNIYTIYADGSNVDLDGDGDNDIDYDATKDNVEGVFEMLADNLTEDDELFVYTTNHGGNEGYDIKDDMDDCTQDVYLCLYYEQSLLDNELADLIDDIDAGKMKFTFEQCFSGGFVDDFSALNKNIVLATACDWDEVSYGALDPPGWGADGYDEFVYWWNVAMLGAYPPSALLPGTHPTAPDPKDADADNDGKVTLKEAFDFAEANDRWDGTPPPPYDDTDYCEHPQYYSNPDDAGEEWTLCKKIKIDCCGESSKGETALLFGLFALSYAVILIRRKLKK